jgi:NAD+ synthase
MSIKDQAIAWVKDYFAKNGNSETKALIGISGGKDSATVAALCCAALGKDRVIGVMMPNGVQADIEDSKKICAFLGIKNYTVNIANAYKGLTEEIKAVTGLAETPAQYNTNTPARLRMATLYSIAAIEGNCRISNNGNKSECLVGYFTLWGDGAGDFAPLANLYVDEVVELGKSLGLPSELCDKAPSDGMYGKTDEDNLGFTYADLRAVAEGKTEGMDTAKVEAIKKRIDGMDFKKRLLNLPCFLPSFRK